MELVKICICHKFSGIHCQLWKYITKSHYKLRILNSDFDAGEVSPNKMMMSKQCQCLFLPWRK